MKDTLPRMLDAVAAMLVFFGKRYESQAITAYADWLRLNRAEDLEECYDLLCNCTDNPNIKSFDENS